MTIAQIVFDALAWCRYFAVNKTIGRPEVKLIFYEAFENVYNQAVTSHPEYFTVSAAISGTSWTIPSNFRQEIALVVDDAGCTAGYAKVVDNTEWDTRQSSTRNAATVTDPQALKGTSVFTIAPTITGGKAYYIRNYSESDFTDETKDLSLYLPIIYHYPLLAKMTELIQMRHFQLPDSPTEREKHLAVMKASAARMKRALKPLEVIEGLTEKPQGLA